MSDPFGALAGELDYPMFIVTAASGGEADGCLVGFGTQCSIDPPRFLACISVTNRTYRIAQNAAALAVHVVPEDAEDLVELFGGETADEVDKLAQVEWSSGPGGAPLLARCPNRFAGPILNRTPLGDHVGFLVDPIEVTHGAPRQRAYPFSRAKRIEPGHPA